VTRRGGIKRAGDVLSSIIESLKLGPGLAGWRAVNSWEEIAGPRYAEHTKALKYEGGRLYIEVDNSAWTAQLGMEKPLLLRKIAEKVGPGVVRDLMFVVAGRPAREEDT
jgi:predicted nucleic acid-binding Zn ribbon protein